MEILRQPRFSIDLWFVHGIVRPIRNWLWADNKKIVWKCNSLLLENYDQATIWYMWYVDIIEISKLKQTQMVLSGIWIIAP